jgi:hypothetical protein
MAKGASKKVIAENKKALKFLRRGSWAASLFHLVIHLTFPGRRQSLIQNPSRWGMFASSCLLSFACYRYLDRESRVIYDERTKELLTEGASITQPGLYEYVFDLIYLSWLLQIASVISFYVWLGYLVVPGYALYKLWTKLIGPWIFGSKQVPISSEGSLKAEQKFRKERQPIQRSKYVHG